MMSAAEIMAYKPSKGLFDQRLVALFGPAGSGKTRLLLEIAKLSGNTLCLAPTHYLKRSCSQDFRHVWTVAKAALSPKRAFQPFRTVMITEAAMVRDLEITLILRKLASGTRLYLDCDPYQISAITDAATKPIIDSSSFKQLLGRPTTLCVRMTEQFRTRNLMVMAVIDAIQQQNKSNLLESLMALILHCRTDIANVPYNDEDIVVAHTNAIRNYVWEKVCVERNLQPELNTNLVLGHQVRLLVTKKQPAKPGSRKKQIVYANGDMCTLLEVSAKHVRVQLDDETEHKVPHLPDGSPAVSQTGCLTAYATQGMTASGHVYVVCDTPSLPPPICISTLYVMLTRARTHNRDGPPDNLHFVVHNWPRFRDALSAKIMGSPFSPFQQEFCRLLYAHSKANSE